MPVNNVKLNCNNFFTYFAFHPNDKQLNAKDRKTAKLATILFAFSIFGHAICRLFAYKKIIATTTKTINKTDLEGKRRFSTDIPPQKNSSSTKQSSQISKASQESSSEEYNSPKPRSTCLFVLKEIIKAKALPDALPSMFDAEPPEDTHPAMNYSDMFQKAFPKTSKERAFHKFQHTTLLQWPFLNPAVLSTGNSTSKQNKKLIKKLDFLVEKRLKQFDEACQARQRIKGLERKDHLQLLTMEDLADPVLQSPLTIAALSPNNLGDISFHDLIGFNERQMAMVKHRLPLLEKIEVKTLPNDFRDLTLLQLHSLTGQQLSENLDRLTIKALELVSDDQIKEMDFSSLKAGNEKHQDIFKRLFPLPTISSGSRLVLLDHQQLSDCWDQMDNEMLQALSDKQIHELNGGTFLNSEQFKELFPLEYSNNPSETSKIKHLSDEAILLFWECFDSKRIKYLSNDQLRRLDFTIFERSVEDRNLLEALFTWDNLKDSDRSRDTYKNLDEKQKEIVRQLLAANIWNSFV